MQLVHPKVAEVVDLCLAQTLKGEQVGGEINGHERMHKKVVTSIECKQRI